MDSKDNIIVKADNRVYKHVKMVSFHAGIGEREIGYIVYVDGLEIHGGVLDMANVEITREEDETADQK